MRRLYPLLLGLLMFSACDTEAAADPGVTVVDSAGVQVVVNDAPAWAAEDGWRLGDVPRLEIGALEGDAEYQFDRVIGAATLTDGRIAVADMGSSEVRLFDETGQHVASIGGAGDGPGEFRQITGIHRLPGDVLAVEDRREQLELIRPNGTYLEAIGMGGMGLPIDPVAFHENPPSAVRVVGWLDEDSFLGWESTQVTLSADGRFEEAETLEYTYSRFGSGGEVLGEIARLSGATFHPHPMNLVLTAVFGPKIYSGTTGDRLVLADSGSGEISWHTPEGELERVARRSWVRRPVTEAMVERYVEGSSPPLSEDIARGRTFAEELPTFSQLIVDANSNLWLREYEVSHAFTLPQYQRTFDDPSNWAVLDSSGRWLGDVEMPHRFTVLEVGDDYVLGMTRDEFDVEYIQLYDLVKP